MYFYLVKDASKWMSNLVFQSVDQAILSQSWRVDDSDFDVSNDFPLTILQIDTEIGLIKEITEVSKAELMAEAQAHGCLKKGGSK